MSGIASGPISDRLAVPTGLSTTTPTLLEPPGETELHPRTLIRRFVVQRLRDAAADAAGRVFSNRSRPLQKADLPALVVYTRNEASPDVIVEAPRVLRRRLELVVEVYAAVEDDTDEVLDTIAERCEVIVHRDETQGGLCDRTLLARTESELSKDGDTTMGCLRLVFDCTYNLQTEEDVMPALTTMDTQWNTDDQPPETLIEASLTFTEP